MKKRNNIFVPGDIIEQKIKTATNGQKLEIDFIDFTRQVYIFKEPWVNSLSQHTSFDIEKINNLFQKINE